ncbi:MAG: D-glucuronyl C5-epimerase family protein [Mesorhizobium sp.]
MKFLSLVYAAYLLLNVSPSHAETWPKPVVTDAWRALGEKEIATFSGDPLRRVSTYEAGKTYMNYGTTMSFRATDRLQFDEQGLPKIKYGKEFHYNVVTLCNYALAAYDRHLSGAPLDQFLTAAEQILSMQGEDGSFTVNFPFRHYTQKQSYKVPQKSAGMGTAMSLSVFARALEATKDPKWLEAGNKALDHLATPFPAGPMSSLIDLDPSLSDYVFFLEYKTKPHTYELNGYQFALLGVYDWSKIAESEKAGDLFRRGIDTLEKLLPYYDLETISAYDLTHYTFGINQPYLEPRNPHLAVRYHVVHIGQLTALASVTGSEILKHYADKWLGYMNAEVSLSDDE